MAFVGLGGVAGSLQPTYFELLAADRLTPGLKGALVYSLSVRLFPVNYPSQPVLRRASRRLLSVRQL
jgi:hypothetical protein